MSDDDDDDEEEEEEEEEDDDDDDDDDNEGGGRNDSSAKPFAEHCDSYLTLYYQVNLSQRYLENSGPAKRKSATPCV